MEIAAAARHRQHVASAGTERSFNYGLPPFFPVGRERSEVRGGAEVPADGSPGAGELTHGAGDPQQEQDAGAEPQPGLGRWGAAARSYLLAFNINNLLF